jgi:hypothetical protein
MELKVFHIICLNLIYGHDRIFTIKKTIIVVSSYGEKELSFKKMDPDHDSFIQIWSRTRLSRNTISVPNSVSLPSDLTQMSRIRHGVVTAWLAAFPLRAAKIWWRGSRVKIKSQKKTPELCVSTGKREQETQHCFRRDRNEAGNK